MNANEMRKNDAMVCARVNIVKVYIKRKDGLKCERLLKNAT